MTPRPPSFIVFEGIDGSGTTTQSRRIAEGLRRRGHRVHETREPSTGPIGAMTRSMLAQGTAETVDAACLALLFAADRLEHLAREIEPALAAGEIVLCDRYVVSSWVYQSLDCDPAWVRRLNERARWPDLTFVFDLDAGVARARVLARGAETGQVRERFDVDETQRKLAAGYAAVLADPTLTDLVRVDAAGPIDAVSAAIDAELVRRGR